MVSEQERCKSRLDVLELDAVTHKVQSTALAALQQQQQDLRQKLQDQARRTQRPFLNIQALANASESAAAPAAALPQYSGDATCEAIAVRRQLTRQSSFPPLASNGPVERELRELVYELRSMRHESLCECKILDESIASLGAREEGTRGEGVDIVALVRELREERRQVVDMLSSIEERKLETVKLMHEFFLMKDSALKDLQTALSDAMYEIQSSLEVASGSSNKPNQIIEASPPVWGREVDTEAVDPYKHMNTHMCKTSSRTVLCAPAPINPSQFAVRSTTSPILTGLGPEQSPGRLIAQQPYVPSSLTRLQAAQGQEGHDPDAQVAVPALSPRLRKVPAPAQVSSFLPTKSAPLTLRSVGSVPGSVEMPHVPARPKISTLPLWTLPAPAGVSPNPSSRVQTMWPQSERCSPRPSSVAVKNVARTARVSSISQLPVQSSPRTSSSTTIAASAVPNWIQPAVVCHSPCR